MSAIEADVIAGKVLVPWRNAKGEPYPVKPARPRARTHLVRMGNGWPDSGRIGLPIPEEIRQAAFQNGAEEADALDDISRVCVPRVHAVKDVMQPYVPFIACRSIVPISFPALPMDTFEIALRTVLTEDTWSRIQARAVRARGGVCEICGDGAVPQAVPVWHHVAPDDPQMEGVRRLERLLVVCSDCADMFHQDADGRIVAPSERLMAVNAWTAEEWESHEAWRRKVSAMLTGHDWVIDLSVIADEVPLEIAQEWEVDQKAWRLRKTGGRLSTLVLGVPFSVAGTVYEAQPLQPFLDVISGGSF